MKQYPVALQLYSLREEIKQFGFEKVLEKVAGFGYPGVELAGFYEKQPKEIRKTLDNLGLQACSSHGAVPADDNLAQIVDAAGELGYSWHVTGFGPASLTSADDCREKAELLQAGAIALKQAGLKLAMHNHYWEFDKKFSGKYPHQILMENAPDVYAQVDTYWAAVAGVDVPRVVAAINDRVPLLHIKDGLLVRELPMTAVGDGKMDFAPIIRAADEKTLEWLIVELDSCATDMLEAVRKSICYLAANGYGRGRV